MTERRLAHYEILDLLGKGGMGEVHRARDSERMARFRREARVLASLNHPSIVISPCPSSTPTTISPGSGSVT